MPSFLFRQLVGWEEIVIALVIGGVWLFLEDWIDQWREGRRNKWTSRSRY